LADPVAASGGRPEDGARSQERVLALQDAEVVQGRPGLNRSSQGTEQGNEDGSHAANLMLVKPKK
jgi:hypothetical protein